jgi:exopolysaccharide biosynthesis polyprenyl glycosylphosphotransferase
MNLLKLSDICIFIAGIFSASWLITTNVQGIDLQEFLSIRVKVINLIYILSMIVLWHTIFDKFNLYRSKRLESKIQEWVDIFKATTLGTGMIYICGRVFNIETLSLNFCLTFWFSTTIFTILFRSSLRYFLKIVRLSGRNLRFILIVGTNQRAYDIERWINNHKEVGYRVKGYLDDLTYRPNKQISILGKLASFPEIIRSTIIDEVIITLPVKSQYEKIQKIIEQGEEQGITVRYFSTLFDTNIATAKTSSFAGSPVLTMVNRSHENWSLLAKRTIDIVLASALLILTSPLMLVAAVAIKLTSPVPIFFIQDRVGYNKRIFRLYKFRTMVADAEKLQKDLELLNEMDGPAFKIQNDPRITKTGKWLRKTSLDELPQLFNVLKGDMSLVGPRPLPLRDFNGFDKDWQRRRFSVRPGITCLWQISGRNNIPFEEWMQLDMQYIDQWSLWLDFKILAKTIPVVLKRSGAI